MCSLTYSPRHYSASFSVSNISATTSLMTFLDRQGIHPLGRPDMHHLPNKMHHLTLWQSPLALEAAHHVRLALHRAPHDVAILSLGTFPLHRSSDPRGNILVERHFLSPRAVMVTLATPKLIWSEVTAVWG